VCGDYTLSAADAVDADPQCPMCEEYGRFVPYTPRASLAERWGADLARGGFWQEDYDSGRGGTIWFAVPTLALAIGLLGLGISVIRAARFPAEDEQRPIVTRV
jgi:hypothetical protein